MVAQPTMDLIKTFFLILLLKSSAHSTFALSSQVIIYARLFKMSAFTVHSSTYCSSVRGRSGLISGITTLEDYLQNRGSVSKAYLMSHKAHGTRCTAAPQRQTAVTAYLKSKQLLLFVFAHLVAL